MKIKVDRDEYYRLRERVTSLEKEIAICTSYCPRAERLKQEWTRAKQSLNEKYEDVLEEPKEYWCIDWTGGINNIVVLDDVDEYEEDKKEIGNYFSSKEEAEKAVEKLKAWQRMKDHNLRIERGQRVFVNADNKLTSQKPLFVVDTYEEVEEDLDLLFGGEE